MKISIVIPIYKVEPYIERCIRSVLAQTYRELEVILVDDSSPDDSMDIAQKVIKDSGAQDMAFVYLKHEHNRGLSAARNTGIDAATGEYVYFLDSDDALTPNCIELLVQPLIKKRYDFVIGNYGVIGSDKRFSPLTIEGEYNDVLEQYRKASWYMMAVNKVVNLQMMKENQLYFQEGIIHEDELWSFQLAYTAKNLFAVQEVTYLYYIRENSIITSESKDSKIKVCITIAYLMWDYLDNHGMSKDIKANNQVERFVDGAGSFFFMTSRSEGYKYYQYFRKNIHRKKGIFWYLSFSSLSSFRKYCHYLLPAPLAYGIKRAVRHLTWKA